MVPGLNKLTVPRMRNTMNAIRHWDAVMKRGASNCIGNKNISIN